MGRSYENGTQTSITFEVKSITHDMIFELKKALEPFFLTCKPVMKIKAARMIKIDQESPFRWQQSRNGHLNFFENIFLQK